MAGRVTGGDSSGICGLGMLARFNKSTAWRVLAGDENFYDERIIGRDSREVQEQGIHLDPRKRRTGRAEEGRGRSRQGARKPTG